MSGSNTALVEPRVGLNALFLTASADPRPDVVALAATGVVDIPDVGGTGAFAVATVNVSGAVRSRRSRTRAG